MPEVVLRNPNLPGQPIVLNLAPGEKVSIAYRQMGFDIDAATTPSDARAELAETQRVAAERAAADAENFVAAFEDDDDEPSATQPAGELTAAGDQSTDDDEQGDTSLDLTKEK